LCEAPDHELDPVNTQPIDDSTVASVGRREPRLGVAKSKERATLNHFTESGEGQGDEEKGKKRTKRLERQVAIRRARFC